MENIFPLYSRGRPLKNLIADKGDLIETESVYEEFLYNSVKNHWYFSDIGFDTDDMFIFRFKAVWNLNISKYLNVLSNEAKMLGMEYEQTEYGTSVSHTGNDTSEENNTVNSSKTKALKGDRRIDDNGTDTHQIESSTSVSKGIKQTDTTVSSAEGNRLTRATPNEVMDTQSKDITTIEYSSGVDTTSKNDVDSITYGKTTLHSDSFEENESVENSANNNKTNTYNSKFNKSGDVTVRKLTPEQLMKIVGYRAIAMEFALLFEKLFMEVF